MSDDTIPQERAEAAAEALAADGKAVTVRAVREISGVSTNVAADAAKNWNAQHAAALAELPVPEAVNRRFKGMWNDAVEAVRAEHQAERDGWAANISVLEGERDAATQDTIKVEERLDQAEARIAELEEAVKRAEAEAAQAHARVTEAEAQVTEALAGVVAAEQATAVAEAVASALREALAAVSLKSGNGSTATTSQEGDRAADVDGGADDAQPE